MITKLILGIICTFLFFNFSYSQEVKFNWNKDGEYRFYDFSVVDSNHFLTYEMPFGLNKLNLFKHEYNSRTNKLESVHLDQLSHYQLYKLDGSDFFVCDDKVYSLHSLKKKKQFKVQLQEHDADSYQPIGEPIVLLEEPFEQFYHTGLFVCDETLTMVMSNSLSDPNVNNVYSYDGNSIRFFQLNKESFDIIEENTIHPSETIEKARLIDCFAPENGDLHVFFRGIEGRGLSDEVFFHKVSNGKESQFQFTAQEESCLINFETLNNDLFTYIEIDTNTFDIELKVSKNENNKFIDLGSRNIGFDDLINNNKSIGAERIKKGKVKGEVIRFFDKGIRSLDLADGSKIICSSFSMSIVQLNPVISVDFTLISLISPKGEVLWMRTIPIEEFITICANDDNIYLFANDFTSNYLNNGKPNPSPKHKVVDLDLSPVCVQFSKDGELMDHRVLYDEFDKNYIFYPSQRMEYQINSGTAVVGKVRQGTFSEGATTLGVISVTN